MNNDEEFDISQNPRLHLAQIGRKSAKMATFTTRFKEIVDFKSIDWCTGQTDFLANDFTELHPEP